jgi:hypothetical protein
VCSIRSGAIPFHRQTETLAPGRKGCMSMWGTLQAHTANRSDTSRDSGSTSRSKQQREFVGSRYRVERAAATAFSAAGAGSPVGPAARTRKQPPAKSGDPLAAGSLWAIQLAHESACWDSALV